MKKFNIRVYGICVNEKQEVLLSHEQFRDLSFTKFPGGGLEWGEGTVDCLQREFREEFGVEIAVGELFYLTDFFQLSAFSENDQVISIYYRFTLLDPFDKITYNGDKHETLQWMPLTNLKEAIFRFPIDKIVAGLLKK